MTTIVDRPAPLQRLRAELAWSRERAAVAQRESVRAAHVQHALSTSDQVTIGTISAVSELECLNGAGGDFVDLIECDGVILAVLGDVSGKGSAAALVAAVVLSSVQHHVAQLGVNPGQVLAAVDRSVSAMLDRTGHLVTLVIAAVDPTTSSLRIAAAGHHPVVLATPAGTSRLAPSCPPLGAQPPCGAELELRLEPGSALVLVSDGLTEQPNPEGSEFGLERLSELTAVGRRDSPRAIVARLLSAVDRHAGAMHTTDDKAIVVISAGDRS